MVVGEGLKGCRRPESVPERRWASEQCLDTKRRARHGCQRQRLPSRLSAADGRDAAFGQAAFGGGAGGRWAHLPHVAEWG